jgi:galactose-1-phosphate uridylyltransferase
MTITSIARKREKWFVIQLIDCDNMTNKVFRPNS